jgi:hypothetical protein
LHLYAATWNGSTFTRTLIEEGDGDIHGTPHPVRRSDGTIFVVSATNIFGGDISLHRTSDDGATWSRATVNSGDWLGAYVDPASFQYGRNYLRLMPLSRVIRDAHIWEVRV